MAITNVLSVGTTADEESADIVLAAAEVASLGLKDAAGQTISGAARVDIIRKDDAGQYFLIGKSLTASQQSLQVLGPGTFRVVRRGVVSCGVFRD